MCGGDEYDYFVYAFGVVSWWWPVVSWCIFFFVFLLPRSKWCRIRVKIFNSVPARVWVVGVCSLPCLIVLSLSFCSSDSGGCWVGWSGWVV